MDTAGHAYSGSAVLMGVLAVACSSSRTVSAAPPPTHTCRTALPHTQEPGRQLWPLTVCRQCPSGAPAAPLLLSARCQRPRQTVPRPQRCTGSCQCLHTNTQARSQHAGRRVCWGLVSGPACGPCLPTPAAHLCAGHRPERCWPAACRADRTAGPHRGCPPGHCTADAVPQQRARCRAERRLAPSRLLHMVLKTAGSGRAELQAPNNTRAFLRCLFSCAPGRLLLHSPGPRWDSRRFRRIGKLSAPCFGRGGRDGETGFFCGARERSERVFPLQCVVCGKQLVVDRTESAKEDEQKYPG